MAGIGERMKGAGFVVFGADGWPKASESGPPPDDETLERLRLQGERYRRLVPNAPDTPCLDHPLIYKNRPTRDDADSGE